MKKISILLLTLIMLILPIMSLASCDVGEKTIIGEIKYVDWAVVSEPGTDKYYIVIEDFSILPYGQDENARWEYFNVRFVSDPIYSADATYLDVKPELAIGNIVEVEYKTTASNSFWRNVISVKLADTSAEIPKQENIALKLNRDFSYTKPEGGLTERDGTVIRVVKIEAPLSGYLVYFIGTTPYAGDMQCHWVGNVEIGVTSAEVFEKLEAGEVGYTVAFDEVSGQHPFSNYLASAILNVRIVSE